MQYIIEKLQKEISQYRPLPFWSWNDELQIDVLKEQIHWMKENGMGGFFMHARTGLETEYLSENWMSCVESCSEEAKKLGMTAWAYDENGFPSGFAGGKLLENIENRDRYLQYTIGSYDKEATVSYMLDTDELVRVHAGEDGKEYLNIYIQYSVSTVDVTNPNVVQQFLDITHEKYKEHFGEKFSEFIKGFFTDEPEYYGYATPYTPMLEKYFMEQYQEDVLDKLGLLFVEKNGYRQFRYRYWLAMQTLLLEGFAKQVYEWCDKNGVQLTGHYVEENSIGMQLVFCGGIMPFYEYEHIPGCDCLARTVGNPLPAKQVASVARQLGKKQVLTESFGCCGWNVTPGELRSIAGYQYANGVNLLCHHLLPYSERGARKRDYPAHFSRVNPWVDDNFKDFNDYFTRLGYLIGESEEPVNVAMLHPVRSGYFDFKREASEEGYGVAVLDKQLQEDCKLLSARGINYHFLDETLLEKYGFVKEGKIGCGQCEYTYLVLPHLITMGSHTEKLLHEFVNQGGKVLLLGNKPTDMEGLAHEYSYLESNCDIEEIEEKQPFRIEKPHEDLCYTYRLLDNTPFVYVQNASGTQSYKQTLHFGEQVQSFEKLDLVTLEREQIGLEVTLEPNEGVLLFPSDKPCQKQKPLEEYTMTFDHAKVKFDTNFMLVDRVRYSKDGVQYSDSILCQQLFEKLLEQRYEGKLYVRYEFEVEKVPSRLVVLAEKSKAEQITVNGKMLHFHEVCEEEHILQKADITSMVHTGINAYEVVMNWHQTEETYYALFGENVTDCMRHCLTYDSELEAIYLAGNFGVYSHGDFIFADDGVTVLGKDFYIGEAPQYVKEPTVEGLPFFRGKLTLSQTVVLPQSATILNVAGGYTTAKIRVNGQEAGTLYFDRKIDISDYAKQGENEIEITFILGNRNLLGPFILPCPDDFIGPMHFQTAGLPEEDFRYRLYLFN